MFTLPIDPPTPEDGICAHCGLPKTQAQVESLTDNSHPFKTKISKKTFQSRAHVEAAAALDPFCSADCCRVFHGLLLEYERQAILERRNNRRVCKGCKGPLDEVTPGCHNCKTRAYQRERAKLASSAA